MTNDVPNMVEVDPSTICQCTGLKDKNGKLIWENDIMVAHLDDRFPEDASVLPSYLMVNGLHNTARIAVKR
ncbi:MAG: YopX family protein [Lachnospiraceae bacterium]|nr:YopX family protein [Lachnospiraceae bacterium]